MSETPCSCSPYAPCPEHARENYVVARDCGHALFTTAVPSRASMEWCETCRKYVGLIVSRVSIDV